MLHAKWCKGKLGDEDRPVDTCPPPCKNCVRWQLAECECEARNWKPESDSCVTCNTSSQGMKWLNDNHLVCPECGLEGT